MVWIHPFLVGGGGGSISRNSPSNTNRIPFYGYARLVFHLYLVLPQIQGATYLYRLYVDPFLHRNEMAIDNFISAAHDKARTAGLAYVSQVIDYLKHSVFNVPKEPTPPPTPAAYNYAQSLFARFTMPEARPVGSTTGPTDFYGLLASAVGAASSAGLQSREAASTRTLIPESVQGSERLSFIEAQRDRLALLLTALDREAVQLQPGSSSRDVPSSGMTSRRSEPDFEKIDKTSLGDASESYSPSSERIAMGKRTTSSGWRPWVLGAAAAVAASARTPAAEKRAEEAGEGEDVNVRAARARDTGRSTGFEGGY